MRPHTRSVGHPQPHPRPPFPLHLPPLLHQLFGTYQHQRHIHEPHQLRYRSSLILVYQVIRPHHIGCHRCYGSHSAHHSPRIPVDRSRTHHHHQQVRSQQRYDPILRRRVEDRRQVVDSRRI